MNQSGVYVPKPIMVAVAAVTLIETAARDLVDFNEEIPDDRPLALVEPPRAPGRPGSLRRLLAAGSRTSRRGRLAEYLK